MKDCAIKTNNKKKKIIEFFDCDQNIIKYDKKKIIEPDFNDIEFLMELLDETNFDYIIEKVTDIQNRSFNGIKTEYCCIIREAGKYEELVNISDVNRRDVIKRAIVMLMEVCKDGDKK